MCPGLTSAGGRTEDVDEGACVQILAEGTEHACAVGVATMSTADIRNINKGRPVLSPEDFEVWQVALRPFGLDQEVQMDGYD